MDLIIIVAIIVLLSAIVLGSLRRGIQSLISFVLLAGMAAFIVLRLSGADPSASSTGLGLFEGNATNRETPMTAIEAFDTFVQQAGQNIDSLVNSAAGGGQTDIGQTGTGQPGGNGTTPGSGGASNNGTTGGTGNTGTQGNDTPQQPSTGGSVRAWW